MSAVRIHVNLTDATLAELDALVADRASTTGEESDRSKVLRYLIREGAARLKVKRTRAPRGKGA